MYYLTDKYGRINSRRCFDNLRLLIVSILFNDEPQVIKHINSNMESEPISSIEVPYAGTLTAGEIVANWAKQNDKWSEVVWHTAEEMEEEILDAFADCWMDGDEEVLCFDGYVITHD